MSVYVEDFETIFGVENNIKVLRNKVIELAIQGKLVEQDLNDEPASDLVKKIQVERNKLVEKGMEKTITWSDNTPDEKVKELYKTLMAIVKE